jgi:dienelactone hydrolase
MKKTIVLATLLALGTTLLAPIFAQTALTLKASDGVAVYGQLYSSKIEASKHKGLILAFHQAGSNKNEYSKIASRFNTLGYDLLAIDQRSGGAMFEGKNQTADQASGVYKRIDALKDLRAALVHGKSLKSKRIILLGSSYSASLALILAAEAPADVGAVLAMSPNDGALEEKGATLAACKKLTLPVWIATTKAEEGEAMPLFKALTSPAKKLFSVGMGLHGASALANPMVSGPYWKDIEAFLATLK